MSKDSEVALNLNTIKHLRSDIEKYRDMIRQYQEIIDVSLVVLNECKADLYRLDYKASP